MTRFIKNASKTIQSAGKTVGRAIYAAGKKRYTKGGKANVGQIVKDVAFLKSVLNPEKKRFEIGNSSAPFGQTLNSPFVSGALLTQFSFGTGIVQGTNSSTRNGNSIKCNSIIFKARFQQQSGVLNPIRYRVVIFTCKGAPQTTGNIAASLAFWENNIFSGVVDYNSDRNPDQFADFQILGQRTGRLMGDTLANQSQFSDMTIPIKTNKHMRWDNAGNLQEFPVYMYCTADTGDAGVAATGVVMQYSARTYFYDN